MIRSALILGSLSMAAVCIAAVPSASAGVCDANNAQSFINAIEVLDQNYVLHPPGSAAYWPPFGVFLSQLNLPPNSPIITDLMNAFQNAPPTFRARLCGATGTPGLNGIFINAKGCAQNDPTRCNLNSGGANFNRAWGFRSYDSSDFGATYMAISAADLWRSGNSARPLSNYETQLLQSFPGWSGATVAPASPDGSGTHPDTSWMSVLAAMAHEVGHVRWVQTIVPEPGGGYDLSLLIGCPTGDFFAGWAYNSTDDLVPPNRWRPFRNRSSASGHAVDHSSAPFLFGPFGLDNPQTANSDLWSLYQPGQPWASLFAAQTPDEDVVESYVLAVLTGYDPIAIRYNGPLTSMPVNIPNTPSSPDVVNDLVTGHKLPLQNKIACVPL